MKINGVIINGLGCASRTLTLQLPHLIEYEPEFMNNYPATINVQMESPLKIMKWDITTKPIAWMPDQPEIVEVFSFRKIVFDYLQQSHSAWIYYPHDSPNRADPFRVEIFTKEIALSDNKNCSIIIEQSLRSASWLVLE